MHYGNTTPCTVHPDVVHTERCPEPVTLTDPRIARVRVEVTDRPGLDGVMVKSLDVNPIWEADGGDLDRVDVGGWCLGSGRTAERYAKRLEAALTAGVVYSNPRVVRDVIGQTYVEADKHVMGRHMNADLKRLGF